MASIEKRIQISNIMVLIGLLTMVIMAILPLLNFTPSQFTWMRWAFAGGAILVLVARVLGAYNGPVLRIKRLHRILIASAMLYCTSALMMFISQGTNDWIGFLLSGVLVQLYASVMIDIEEKKSSK